MVLAPRCLPHALEILDRALTLTRSTGQTLVEAYVLQTISIAHVFVGAIDDAERVADEFATIARQRQDEEAEAYALAVDARIKVARGDLAGARSQFADAVALAAARSAAWARAIALCGLASATLGTGDDEGARAILEEALFFCAGVGYLGIDTLCGALALLLIRANERDRASRVFEAAGAGAEEEASFTAASTDPSGTLRAATREARSLLGNPPPLDHPLDLDAVLQAAIGHGRQPF
jgi:hypothetical protein